MEIKLRRLATIYIIDIIGEMDLYHAFRLKDVVKKMIERNIRNYIINLDAVDYIDSSGIGALLHVHAELKKRNLPLCITNVKGTVKKVIELTKLNTYFPLVADTNTAIRQLQTAGQSTHEEG